MNNGCKVAFGSGSINDKKIMLENSFSHANSTEKPRGRQVSISQLCSI